MNFKPHLAALVLSGEKTVTRRLTSTKPGSPWWIEGCSLVVNRDYAVCPGRGKPALGRIVVTEVRLERLGHLDDDEARREGFASAAAFEQAFADMHGRYDPDVRVWRVEFRPQSAASAGPDTPLRDDDLADHLRDGRLSDEALANGYRLTDDGLIYGTPRTGEDDWRFAKASAPADAFAPNGAQVWAVLDRITWFTLDDAHRLLDAAIKVGTPPDHHRAAAYAASRAAGGDRAADWDVITQLVGHTCRVICPAAAGSAPGHRSGPATGQWNHAFGMAQMAAEAFLVADRPELTPEGLDALTAAWRRAFA